MTGKYPEKVGGNSAGALKAFIERVERLEGEKTDLTTDIRDIYAEAKGNGFDPKIMRIMVRRRKMAKAERDEQDALIDTYSAALGMLPVDEPDEVEEPNGD